VERVLFGSLIASRRAVLRTHFDVQRQFEEIEESCIPSYVHANLPAAWVAWQRNRAAAALYMRHAAPGPILDFGSATGEVGHLIQKRGAYHIIEQDDVLAKACGQWQDSRRITLDDAKPRTFSAIFALDSLEHNEDIPALISKLIPLMRDDGVFILSGPTENGFYRLGRKLAGFSGHYHHCTIHDIERLFEEVLERTELTRVPVAPSLFRVTAWRKRSSDVTS